MHVVVRLSNMPTEKEDVIDWMDTHISTLNPDMDDNSTTETYNLKEIVRGFMLHKCSDMNKNNPTGCRNEKGICKKFFHLNSAQGRSSFDDKVYLLYIHYIYMIMILQGFPIYKRRASDLNVVTYNRLISLDYEGHG